MKVLTTITLLMIFSLVASATEFPGIKPKKSTDNIPLIENIGGDRLIIYLLHDHWMNLPKNIGTKPFQPGFSFSATFPIKKEHFGFAIGLGISSHNFYSDAIPRNQPFIDDQGVTQDYTGFTVLDSLTTSMDGYGYKNNKFNITYLDVPVEVRFFAGKEDKFRIAAGFKIGFKIGDHTKYKGDDYVTFSDNLIKVKRYYIPFIEKIKYGPTLRVHYGQFSISCYYALTPLFEENKGPDMYPITFGLGYTIF